jgi:predicted histone-like DNA-binding protein
MVKRTDYINAEEEKKTGYYPQVVRAGTIGIKKLCKQATHGTSLNAFEAEIALRMVLEQIEKELLNSHSVCLEGFGTFSLTAESRRVENPNSIRAESIKVKRITFISSRTIMNRIKNAKFVRAVTLS